MKCGRRGRGNAISDEVAMVPKEQGRSTGLNPPNRSKKKEAKSQQSQPKTWGFLPVQGVMLTRDSH